MQVPVHERYTLLLGKYRILKYTGVGTLTAPIGYGLQAFFVEAGLSSLWAYTAQGLLMLIPTFELNNRITWREVPIRWPNQWLWTLTKWCATRIPLLAGARFCTEQLEKVLYWRLASAIIIISFGIIGYLLARALVFAGNRINPHPQTEKA